MSYKPESSEVLSTQLPGPAPHDGPGYNEKRRDSSIPLSTRTI